MRSTHGDSEETTRLLTRASAGDPAALELLILRHMPAVKRSVQRRLRPQTQPRFDASDVIQETHASTLRLFPDFLRREPMPFRLWLLRTAHQRIIDFERTHLHAGMRTVDRELPLPDASSIQLALHVLPQSESPPEQAILKEQAKLVRRCLARLPDSDREVLFLRVFDALPNADVSALLDLPPETTKKRFARALLKLRQLLREAGLERESQ